MQMLALVLVAVLAIGLVFALAMRKVTFDEARLETALRRPGAHTVSYVVPNGQDATLLVAALRHVGYDVVGGMDRGQERVLVACEENQRGEVRRIIEGVHEANFGGPELRVPRVRFEDER